MSPGTAASIHRVIYPTLNRTFCFSCNCNDGFSRSRHPRQVSRSRSLVFVWDLAGTSHLGRASPGGWGRVVSCALARRGRCPTAKHTQTTDLFRAQHMMFCSRTILSPFSTVMCNGLSGHESTHLETVRQRVDLWILVRMRTFAFFPKLTFMRLLTRRRSSNRWGLWAWKASQPFENKVPFELPLTINGRSTFNAFVRGA